MKNKPTKRALYKNSLLKKLFPKITINEKIVSKEEIERLYMIGFCKEAEQIETHNRAIKLIENNTKNIENTWHYYGTKEQMFGKTTEYFDKDQIVRLFIYKYGKLKQIIERRK